ncbi:TetR/AcrR family transcriptional regulator [uncultured Amnibacterium sp.]|uniref:TetR/AcrR family transcriptional regulator n=1 Tax=uncultured Amnibacterium sp. TaxID=1631851 RepID=UPI0035C949CF
MRADGEQNRQRILDVAEDLFAQHGRRVNVADIVAAAGVAPPTLYRHFGDKEGLIKAVSDRAAETAMARLAHALTRSSGIEGLRTALVDSVELARTNRAVRERSGVALSPALERMLLSGWTELVLRGHEEGTIRQDFTASDVPFLFAAAAGIATAVNFDASLLDRYITLLMNSVRPSEELLPGEAPNDEVIRRAFS